MAIIPIPAKFGFQKVDSFRLVRESNVARSRYTGKSQKIIYPYAVWEFKATLVDYPEPEAGAIRGFLAALEGVKNSFVLQPPGYPGIRSGYNGNLTATALTASQSASINVTSSIANVNGILLIGEYIVINGELKVVTQDLNIGAGGTGVLFFQPPMRSNVAAGANIQYVNPYVVMRSLDDDVADWAISAPTKHSIKLNCTEDF